MIVVFDFFYAFFALLKSITFSIFYQYMSVFKYDFLTFHVTKIENRCFLKDTFAKGKKTSKKKSGQHIYSPKKKCNFPLWKQNSLFWKIPPTLHPHSVFPRRYNRTCFYEKNIDTITILHRNLVRFSNFSRITNM